MMSSIDHSNYRTVNEASIHKNVSFFMVRVIFENIPGLQMILKKRGCCMQGNRRGSGGVGGGGDGGWWVVGGGKGCFPKTYLFLIILASLTNILSPSKEDGYTKTMKSHEIH